MNDRRIAIWRSDIEGIQTCWYVELSKRSPKDRVIAGVDEEDIAMCYSHAEAVEAARDWIKANPLAIAPVGRRSSEYVKYRKVAQGMGRETLDIA